MSTLASVHVHTGMYTHAYIIYAHTPERIKINFHTLKRCIFVLFQDKCFNFYYIYLSFVCVHVHVNMYAMVHVWWLEDSFW